MSEVGLPVMRARLQAKIARSTGVDFRFLLDRLFESKTTKAQMVDLDSAQAGNQKDWYEPETGRYYRVHTADAFDEFSAIADIVTALSRLYLSKPIAPNIPLFVDEFNFVVNDAYRITPKLYPGLHALLESSRRKFGLKRCNLFLANDIEDALMARTTVMSSLVGESSPKFGAGFPSKEQMNSILVHIAAMEDESFGEIDDANSDQDPFIDLETTTFTRPWLAAGLLSAASLRSVLRSESSLCERQLRTRLRALYKQTMQLDYRDIPGGPSRSDQCFESLAEQITPLGHSGRCRGLDAAAYAVIGGMLCDPDPFVPSVFFRSSRNDRSIRLHS